LKKPGICLAHILSMEGMKECSQENATNTDYIFKIIIETVQQR